MEIFQCSSPKPLPVHRNVTNTDLLFHGNKHSSIAVKDGLVAVSKLKALGISKFDIKFVDGTYGAFIQDNTGNLIEVVQIGIPSAADIENAIGNGPIKVESMNHIAISVSDISSTIKWYNEILGFKVCNYTAIPLPTGTLIVCRMIVLGGCILEIFEFPGAISITPDRKDPDSDIQTLGNKYFAIAVRDIPQAISDLKALGVEVFSNKVGNVFIRDNAGDPIQIINTEY